METKKVIFFYMSKCSRCDKQKLAIKDLLKMADGLGYTIQELNASENLGLADIYFLDEMPAIIIINGDREVKLCGDIDFGSAVKEINGDK